jgi:hypothetical protein
MKKLIPLLFLCILFIMSCSSQNGTSTSHPFPWETSGEDTLNTSANNISQTTGTSYITWEDSCLSISDSVGTTMHHIKSYDEFIDTLALDTLHNVAFSLKQPGTKYITALQVIYGIDASKHLVLFFKPIALNRISYSSTQSTATYSINQASVASNACYTFDTTGSHHHLVLATPTYVNSAVANFKTHIMVSQSATHPIPGGFNPAQDSTGSTSSVILSFQEIFDYILKNDSLSKSSGKTFSSVNIFNTCIQYTVGSTTKTQVIREDIMLGINNCNIYEDLGHLCPPSCANLTCPVYITQ